MKITKFFDKDWKPVTADLAVYAREIAWDDKGLVVSSRTGVAVPEGKVQTEGGRGSGNFGHSGRPGQVGGSGEGGEPGKAAPAPHSEKVKKALESYLPVTRDIMRAAIANQAVLATAISGKVTPDNRPFDVETRTALVEVKTIIRGTTDKITMHPESLQRKLDAAKASGKTAFTVIFDNRTSKVYYREGLGSFRLVDMTETTVAKLRGVIR